LQHQELGADLAGAWCASPQWPAWQ